MKQQKWEYHVTDIASDRYDHNDPGAGTYALHSTEDKLNELGRDGWELVDATDKREAILKRPVIEEDKLCASPG